MEDFETFFAAQNSYEHSKNFSENYAQFGQVPSQRFANNIVCRKFSKKKIALKGLQIIILFGGHANLVGPENNIFIFSW